MANPAIYAYSNSSTTPQTALIDGKVPPLKVSTSAPSYLRLPDYTYFEKSSSDKNAVSLQTRFLEGSPDDVTAFVTPVFGASDISLMTNAEFQRYVGGGGNAPAHGQIFAPGFYSFRSSDGAFMNTEWVQAFPGGQYLSSVYDRTMAGAFANMVKSSSTEGVTTGLALKIKVPKVDFNFDQVYLGIAADISGAYPMNNGHARIRVVPRSFCGPNKTGLMREASYTPGPTNPWTTWQLRSIPDEYFTDGTYTGNRNLFYPTSAGNSTECIGYKNFAIAPLTSQDSLQSLCEIGVFLEVDHALFETDITCSPAYGSPAIARVKLAQGYGSVYFHPGDWVYFSGLEFPAQVENEMYQVASVDNNSGTVTLTTPYTGAYAGTDTAHMLQPICRFWLEELCFVFHRTASIEGKGFSALQGRTFGGPGETPDGSGKVWDGRKTATDAIRSAPEMLEHLKRLQNWGELGETAVTVGKEYDSAAQITTGPMNAGSYDNQEIIGTDSTIGSPAYFRPAFQITSDSEAWTESLSRKLCKTFGLQSYIGVDGSECLGSFIKHGLAGLPTLTFADLPKGQAAGQVIEPRQQDVFCEPIVKYQYDPGPQKFKSFLAVTDTNADLWDAEYTPGFDNTTVPGNFASDPLGIGATGMSDGQYVWTYCKGLFGRYGQVEKCPSDFIEQPMIARYEDVLSYLVYRFQVMQYCRIDFPTFYTKARYWHFGQHISLSLPSLGAGPYECLIEKISKDKERNSVKMTLLILDSLNNS